VFAEAETLELSKNAGVMPYTIRLQMNKEKQINQYQEIYLNQYGFEAQMVRYRQRMVIERLNAIKPKTVIEVGCGADLLYQHYIHRGDTVDQWIIVEPGTKFYGIASKSGLPNLITIQGFFEEAVPQIKTQLPTPPDMIIMSGVLHEVASPRELLRAAKSLMGQQSVLHVNVPNATSLHRMLGKSMGLIKDVKDLSTRNIELSQQRVYDAASLRIDIDATGLSVVSEGGYLVKPFTNDQMQTLSPQLGAAVLDGLYQLGKDLPALASEIYLEARKA
jgi:2-polyprenyl-3-methyl-5-hydroxy-6-metoxy-1,4-benzoquinol methylase